MRYSNEGSFRRQFDFLRRQFLQDGELPFTDVLSRETVTQGLDTIENAWNDSIYTPLVTLWVFLGQVLSADHSCRNAVARLIVHRVSRGLSPCSSITGAFSLQQRGVDTVTRLNKATRKADFRRGKRLGTDDHIVRWPKPSMRNIDRETYKAMPEYITVRETRVRVEQPGFRTKVLIVVTTLLDPEQYSKEDLADLYRERMEQRVGLKEYQIRDANGMSALQDS